MSYHMYLHANTCTVVLQLMCILYIFWERGDHLQYTVDMYRYLCIVIWIISYIYNIYIVEIWQVTSAGKGLALFILLHCRSWRECRLRRDFTSSFCFWLLQRETARHWTNMDTWYEGQKGLCALHIRPFSCGPCWLSSVSDLAIKTVRSNRKQESSSTEPGSKNSTRSKFCANVVWFPGIRQWITVATCSATSCAGDWSCLKYQECFHTGFGEGTCHQSLSRGDELCLR